MKSLSAKILLSLLILTTASPVFAFGRKKKEDPAFYTIRFKDFGSDASGCANEVRWHTFYGLDSSTSFSLRCEYNMGSMYLVGDAKLKKKKSSFVHDVFYKNGTWPDLSPCHKSGDVLQNSYQESSSENATARVEVECVLDYQNNFAMKLTIHRY